MASNRGLPTRHNNLAAISDAHCHNYNTFASWEEYDSDDYGNIGERGKEILIERPADSVKTLAEQKHIEVQLFLYNREKRDKVAQQPNDGTVLFDRAVLSLMDMFLDIENFDRESCTIPEKYLKILFLMECRELDLWDDREDFIEYLAETANETQELLDISDPHGDDLTILRLNKRLTDELSDTEFHKLRCAATRTVYGALREGVEPPEKALDAHDIDIEQVREDAPNIGPEDERRALCNWIEYLIDNTIDPLTLERKESDIDWDMVDLLGVMATSALSDSGRVTASNISKWNYDDENVPTGQTIKKEVPKLDALVDIEEDFVADSTNIDEQFDEVFDNLLELAYKHNFFDGPQDLAVDTTDLLWNSDKFEDIRPEERPTVKIRPKRDVDTNRAWRFAVAAIIDNESRFTLGVRLLKSSSYYPAAVDDLVPEDPQYFDLNAIFADAGDVSGSLIREFRKRVDSNWVTKCRKREKGDIKNLITVTPSDRIGYVKRVPWNCAPKPNVIAYPKPYYQEDAREDCDSEQERKRIPKTPIKFPYKLLEKDDPEAVVKADPHRQITIGGDIADTDDDDRSPPPDTEEELIPTDTDLDEADKKRDIHEYPHETGSLYSERRVGNKSTHEVYLTDRELPERSAESMFYEYHERWAIETTNDQIKNDFRPLTSSESPEMQIFHMNIGALFQNWYTMINRAPSPELGLRMEVNAVEVLKAIQHYAFCDGDCAPEAEWRSVD